MTNTPRLDHSGGDTASNTDIVLVILSDMDGDQRFVDIEEIAEAAWKAVPARFSWPRHQQYPDLDAVDVTLRAAKKNDQLVTGSKRKGWMLTPKGMDQVKQSETLVREFLTRFGNSGRMHNRRERGGLESTAVRRLEQLRRSAAVAKHRAGKDGDVTVYDFLAFFGINQYMPDRKYVANRQAIENLARSEPDLIATARLLHDRFGSSYKTLLQQAKEVNDGIA